MYAQYLILLTMLISINLNPAIQTTVLHIGTLFHSNDLQIAQLAIEEINQRSQELFDGKYQLNLLANDSQCIPVYAVDAFFYAIFRQPQILFLVGTSCSNETKAIIQVAEYYNLILFSHSTSFISQVNQTDSTLVRLSVSDENYNDARVAFIKSNSWSHVAILHQDSTEQSLTMAKLAKRLNESNINVLLSQSASMANLTSALQTLRDKKARIVFVNFDTFARAIFFCEVYRTFPKLLRERYVWILTGNDFHLWHFSTENCTKNEILESARGHIVIDSSYEIKPSSINPSTTANKLQARLRLKEHLNRQTLHAYDTIWVIAFLVRASIEHNLHIENFTYSSTEIRNRWLDFLEEIYFLGVSGPVSFRNRQRRAETLISQFRTSSKQYTIEPIAEYSHLFGLNMNCSSCGKLLWTGAFPVDTERNEIRRLMLNPAEITLITASCLLGLALAIFFLTFNILYRHERIIKLSSPKLNNVMVVGAMHIHLSILCFAFDEWLLNRNLFGYACMLRVFLLSGGFSLLFGSMFLKTLRVYRIFTSKNRPLLQSKLLQDHHLLLVCVYLYTIDFLIALLWQIFDPHSARSTRGSIRQFDIDLTVSDEISYCHSAYRHKILPLIYCSKSLFLVIGGYLAAKTRHVHIAALNDSKFIVWSIYIVVLTSLFTVIVMISMQNLRIYVAISFVVVLMTSSILCVIFLPKVIRLKRNQHRGLHEVISKDLVVDDSRTRRFAIEIGYYEKYRYAQLQNRELNAELIRLNHIIHALEHRFDSKPTNVAKALFPIAVRLATTFMIKTDHQLTTNKTNCDVTLETSSADSGNTLFNFEYPSSSSSSALNLSLVFQPTDELSSLPLSALDNEEYLSTDDEDKTSLSLTRSQQTSDNESVLYLRLADELNIDEARLESDLERPDRLY